jgi:hypothetical protein
MAAVGGGIHQREAGGWDLGQKTETERLWLGFRHAVLNGGVRWS